MSRFPALSSVPPSDASCTAALRRRRLGLLARDGYTIVELLTAATVLVIGMLGVVTMIAGANVRTVATRGREGATNVQRELVERARSTPYAQLTQQSVATQLQSLPGLADASPDPGYQLQRRNFTYTVVLGVCSVDDVKDRYGTPDASAACAGSGGPAGSPPDSNPDDYKVVSVDVSWTQGDGHGRSRQQALISSPGSSVGPSLCDISLDGSSNTVITSVLASLTVGLCVNVTPASVSVSVDGQVQGNATGSGTSWTYPWSIQTLSDGNYLVGARAFDAEGRPGAPRSVTVTLNRFLPLTPTGFAAGRNGSVVDMEWLANQERDIVGYRVYRGTTVVASCSFTAKTECQDTAPPNLPLLTYTLKALDRDSAGNLREGAASLPVTVTLLNQRPNPPTNLSVSANASGEAVLSWSAPVPPDPDLGQAIAFYRIYRDGNGVEDRWDRTGLGTDLTWTDPRSGGESHTYWVTAVDAQLAESLFLGPVSS